MLALLLGIVAIVLLALPVGLGYGMMWQLTRGGCAPMPGPDAYHLPYVALVLPGDEVEVPAYFIPSTESDAAVIIAAQVQADAGGTLGYAAMFHDLGLNVLTLGSRQCGGGAGTLGYREAEDVLAGYAYLAQRADIDAGRVSVHGFSAGGAASLFAAAQEPRLRAASAMGNYADFNVIIGVDAVNQSWVERLTSWGAARGYEHSTGVDLDMLRPVQSVDMIAPRPIFLIYGEHEKALPGGRELAARAGEAGSLWIVPGVGHGGYLEASPEAVRERLGGFHRDVLLGAS